MAMAPTTAATGAPFSATLHCLAVCNLGISAVQQKFATRVVGASATMRITPTAPVIKKGASPHKRSGSAQHRRATTTTQWVSAPSQHCAPFYNMVLQLWMVWI